MAVNLAPIGNDAPYVDSNGNPFSGAELRTYTAGSSTPQPTYTTSAGSVQNAVPMPLNSSGYPTTSGAQTQIWLTAGVNYKFELKNSAGTVIWTRDNIVGINDTTISQDQWVAGPAPTFISTTSFSLVGDQTTTFQVGRRLKTTNTGGTVYSTIISSAFAAVTTVTVVNDSGTLDSGLSAVFYGLLTATSPSTPLLADTFPIVSGSADKTKKVRLEADGLTTGTTRVVTIGDRNFSIGIVPTRQVFTSGTAQTYTTPTGATYINIRMVGGGGGGFGAAGGGAGTATTWSGGSLSAGGGAAGTTGGTASSAAATAANGDINLSGGAGQPGVTNLPAATFGQPGAGGNGAFGGGGAAGASTAGPSAGLAGGLNTGGGGGGGGATATTPPGGGGGSGAYCEKRIVAPAATYTYTVGASGAGGTGDANHAAGGAGAAGIIIVDEWYD